jgi:hypothetical protein
MRNGARDMVRSASSQCEKAGMDFGGGRNANRDDACSGSRQFG